MVFALFEFWGWDCYLKCFVLMFWFVFPDWLAVYLLVVCF